MKYSDEELGTLGIVRTKGRARGRYDADIYIYKCFTCGREVTKNILILSRPLYCSICQTNAKAKRKIAEACAQQEAKELEELLGIDHKAEDQFYKASQHISKKGDYQNAIAYAKKYANKYGSVPEAITAIMLASKGISFEPQAKVGRKSVDFLITDKKIVIEVDGAIYHTDENKEAIRDYELKLALGSSWEILHLPAESIMKNPKALEKAIIKRFDKA